MRGNTQSSCMSYAMTRKSSRLVTRAGFMAGAALVVSLVPNTASAQTDPQTSSSDGIGEIVVTALRRTERIEDVPASVSVVTGQELQNAGVVNFQDLGQVTAGAQVNFSGAFTQPAIRGVTTLTNGNNVENNVAVYVDGFYEPSPLILNADLPNLATIEVLKGPQGTLYGRNATGGAILINTLAPSDTLTGRAEITYARFEDKRASAYVTGPFSDSVRASLAAYYRHTDSYVKLASSTVIGETVGPATPITQASVRAKLEIDLSSALQATLGYNLVHIDDPRTIIFTPMAHVSPAVAPPPLRATEPGTASFNYETSAPVTNQQGTLKLALDTGIGTLTSYTGYTFSKQRLAFDFDGTFRDLTYIRINFGQDTFQQSVDYAINAIDKVDLVVGGMYYKDVIETDPFNRTYLANQLLVQNGYGKQRSESWAVYADASIQLTDRLNISLGGRYSDDRKDIVNKTFTASMVQLTSAALDDGWNKFTPRAAIRYEIAPRTNVYASWSKGYRSGAFNFNPPAVASEWRAVSPETITAYEIGFKTAQDIFHFDVAGFYYDYGNLHVATLLRSPQCGAVPVPPAPDTCNQFLNVYLNAPKAEVYGIDAQATASPLENLNLRAGFAWLKATYKKFPNAVGTGLNAATDVNINNQPQDWSGHQMARAPEFSGNVGVDYQIPIGDGGFTFAANASFTSSYVVNNPSLFGPLAGSLAGRQRYRQDGYALINASVTWTEPSGHLHVTLFGRNLTDHTYSIAKTGASNGDYGTLAEPITYGIKLGFEY